MSVYFIGCPEANAVKIGVTWCAPHNRLGQAQVNCPLELRLLGVCDGGSAVERSLHGRFAAHRIRGEWFRLAGEISSFIALNTYRPEPIPRGWHGQRRNRRQLVA